MPNKGWTEEKRAAAAKRARENKPWEKSTGPRTDNGKAAIKNNALKHGGYSAPYKELMQTLKEQEKWLKSLDFGD
jgi:hypothetical protein